MGKREIKIKLTRNNLILFGIVIIAISSFLIYNFYISSLPKPIHSVTLNGQVINFRGDLRKADRIPVYPSEEQLYLELMRPLVQNVTIAFKPAGEKENPYYTIQILELIPKLSIAYSRTGLEPNFDVPPIILDSYENITSTTYSPIIALVHPIYSDENAIRVKDHVICLKAKDYEGFDLVTDKLLMVALELDLGQMH